MNINEIITTVYILLFSHTTLAESGSKCDGNIKGILDIDTSSSAYDYAQQYTPIDINYALKENKRLAGYARVAGVEFGSDITRTRELKSDVAQKLASMGYERLFSCRDTACGNANSLQRKLGIKNTVVDKGEQYQELWVKDKEYYSLYLGKMTFFADNYFVALQHFDLVDIPLETYVRFALDSATLTEHTTTALDRFVEVINEHPKLSFKITGGTDNSGSAPYNHKLGLERARSVYEYLLAQGVMPHVLSYESVGELSPRFANESEAGKEKNRRVDISPLISN
ncbi:OmpA family protein [Pseudoalteromonas sp. BDTF-M6]|uniref:OmpA family protein n=1 Tax=Pseudoalteromonas sp. BDTF-M6 TaxID=2796132 RepID=UPI001BAF2E07|nr:OmpA family protein [Pseudoalteromonas sp. BDTF-M6]MBS3796835.1 OmpA family protein [Pseudoalteromonas sp. BDTF-M6]